MTKEEQEILKGAIIDLTIENAKLKSKLQESEKSAEQRWAWYKEANEKVEKLEKESKKGIVFNGHEIQSNNNRVKHAEGLILQLKNGHDGRNTWLLNYGVSSTAKSMRDLKKLNWDETTQSCETIKDK